jgi:hypothetical protein
MWLDLIPRWSALLSISRYARPRTKKSSSTVPNMATVTSTSIGESNPTSFTEAFGGNTRPAISQPLRLERMDLIPSPGSSTSSSKNRALYREASEYLYARLSESASSPSQERNLPGGQTLYLGESWLLTYVVQKIISAEKEPVINSPRALQVALPPTVGDKAEGPNSDARLEPEEVEILNIRGAFNLPSKEVADKFIQTFFDCVYPAFPIFDRAEFAQLYEAGQQSLLILNSVYAIASTLCDDEVIVKAGFESRNDARKTFLKRAKALHDADYESNKVALVQAVFLLSFLWNGSNDEKDMFYWLSIAIGNAQGKGMHRRQVHSLKLPGHSY